MTLQAQHVVTPSSPPPNPKLACPTNGSDCSSFYDYNHNLTLFVRALCARNINFPVMRYTVTEVMDSFGILFLKGDLPPIS